MKDTERQEATSTRLKDATRKNLFDYSFKGAVQHFGRLDYKVNTSLGNIKLRPTVT